MKPGDKNFVNAIKARLGITVQTDEQRKVFNKGGKLYSRFSLNRPRTVLYMGILGALLFWALPLHAVFLNLRQGWKLEKERHKYLKGLDEEFYKQFQDDDNELPSDGK